MGSSKIIHEFGLQSDLFWDPLGETEIKAAAEQGLSFFEIWGHVPWFDIHSSSMAAEFRAMVEANGMRIRSMHAPCEGDWDISSEDESTRLRSVDEVVLSIDRCCEMDGEIVVVHPGRQLASGGNAAEAEVEHDRRIDKSIRSFEDIMKAAGDNGILVAIENPWSNEVGGDEKSFLRLLDALDPRAAGICFDSSHANITPGSLETIERAVHPIIATHLADNHGEYDEHRVPFTASVDWDRVLKLLLDKGFRGPWLMEVVNGGRDPFGILPRMGQAIGEMKSLIEKLSCSD